ncbi:MAG TPA: DUF3592 domain-containing protein [Thermoanaerobaculia bacterium]
MGGKIFLSLFLSVFLGMGLVFTYLVARSAVGTIKTYRWEETPCRILESGIREDSSGGSRKFVFEAAYEYATPAGSRTSRTIRLGDSGSDDPTDAEKLLSKYPKGASARCYVNPSNREEALLERNSLWSLLFVFLPLIFVAVGGGGIAAVWWKPKPRPGIDAGTVVEPISSKGKRSTALARGCLPAFLGLFFVVGAAVFYFAFFRPGLKVFASRSWPQVPARVISSEVGSHTGDDSTTYSVDVLYEYEFGGRTFRSKRYEFLGGSSSGYDGKAAIVARYPAGSTTVCFVNPEDPTEAVLHRGFTKTYLVALVPILFMVVGGGGAILAFRSRGRIGSAAPGADLAAARAMPATPAISGPGPMKAAASPAAKFGCLLGVALFWNGIVSVFVWQVVKAWRAGGGLGCDALFLLPFVAIGLFLFGAVGHAFLAIFNPRPTLEISSHAIAVGGSANVSWTFTGNVSRIDTLTLKLVGVEEAQYRRGTTTSTDRETFAEITLFESAPGMGGMAASGTARLAVPADTMHSFEAPHNKVIWKLSLRGAIAKWPDVSEEFPIVVTPVREGGGS